MKKYYLILSLTLLLLLFNACKSDKKGYVSEISEIDINKLPRVENIEYGDPEYFSSCKAVKLELTDSSLIARIAQVEICENKIYILDKGRGRDNLLVFDLNGKYIRTIGNKGMAGDEYLSVSSFYLDKKNGIINLFDPQRKAVIQYDPDGVFLKRIKTENENLSFIDKVDAAGNDELFCYSTTNWKNNNMYSVLNAKDFSEIQVIKKYDGEYTKSISYNPFICPIASFDNSVILSVLFSDTLFSYKNGKVSPYKIIKDKRKNISNEELNIRLKQNEYDYTKVARDIVLEEKYNPGISSYFENSRYIVCVFKSKYVAVVSFNAIIWDKEKKDGVYIEDYVTNQPNFSMFSSSYKNTIVRVWQNNSIENFKNKISSDKEVRDKYPEDMIKLIENFDIDQDNPILVLYEFREN